MRLPLSRLRSGHGCCAHGPTWRGLGGEESPRADGRQREHGRAAREPRRLPEGAGRAAGAVDEQVGASDVRPAAGETHCARDPLRARPRVAVRASPTPAVRSLSLPGDPTTGPCRPAAVAPFTAGDIITGASSEASKGPRLRCPPRAKPWRPSGPCS